MILHRTATIPLAIAVLAACHDSSSPTPTSFPLTLRVEVVDTAGAPLPGSYVNWTTWPEAPNRGTTFDPDWRTDAQGRLTLAAGTYPVPQLDSLRLSIRVPGCALAPRDTLLAELALPTRETDTVVVRLTAASEPHATTSVGQSCAYVVDTGFGPGDRLGLRVDSIKGSQFYGRWRLNFNWSRGDDYGALVGGFGPGFVVLTLSMDQPFDQPAGRCDGYHLSASVEPDGSWGTAVLTQPQHCLSTTPVFDFASGQFFTFWP